MADRDPEYIIRSGSAGDLDAVTAVEAACFPAAEAATREEFARRLAVYPDCFWLLEQDGTLLSFVNGMITDEPVIRDEMFADAALHNPHGAWQAIFGVNTLPEFRRQGLAGRVLQQVIRDAKARGCRGCILTCKDKLIHYYETFGFKVLGLSGSVHGGAVWYDMTLEF